MGHDDTLCIDSEKGGDVRSEHEEDEGTHSEDGESGTDW